MLFLHELPYQAGLSGFEKTEAPTRFIVPKNACIEPLLFMYIAKVHVWIFAHHLSLFLTNMNNPIAKIQVKKSIILLWFPPMRILSGDWSKQARGTL